MLYRNSASTGSWLEDYVLHYRKTVRTVRNQVKHKQISNGAALRTLSRCVASAALLSDYCQKHVIALTGGKLPAQFTTVGSDGKTYGSALALDRNSVLTSYVSNKGEAEYRLLQEGDDFSAYNQAKLLSTALMKIAEDPRAMFRITAHHPSLMKRMASFSGEKGVIHRTFTLSVDNDLAYSGNNVYFRRPWSALPVSKLSPEFLAAKAGLVADEARLIAENMVDQGCYTDSPALNGLLVLWCEASLIKRKAEFIISSIGDSIKLDMGKRYNEFRGFNKEMRQNKAEVVQVEPGILAISGAPIISNKSSYNANLPVIKTLINSRVASVEVQQLHFRAIQPSCMDEEPIEGFNWGLHMHYPIKQMMDYVKSSHERLRKERAIMKDLKIS